MNISDEHDGAYEPGGTEGTEGLEAAAEHLAHSLLDFTKDVAESVGDRLDEAATQIEQAASDFDTAVEKELANGGVSDMNAMVFDGGQITIDAERVAADEAQLHVALANQDGGAALAAIADMAVATVDAAQHTMNFFEAAADFISGVTYYYEAEQHSHDAGGGDSASVLNGPEMTVTYDNSDPYGVNFDLGAATINEAGIHLASDADFSIALGEAVDISQDYGGGYSEGLGGGYGGEGYGDADGGDGY
jgi:hypothetical protein